MAVQSVLFVQYDVPRRLIHEEGLLVGGSSARRSRLRSEWRRGGCDGPVVAILADSWDLYLSRPWLRVREGPST